MVNVFPCAEVIQSYRDKIDKLEKDIAEIEETEKEEKELTITEKQMNRAAKKIDPQAALPSESRVWFQSPSERRKEKGSKKLMFTNVMDES